MQNIIAQYTNGNYHVLITDTGTKIRYNNKDTLIPDRPESMDIKITDCCDMGCPYCHENSKPDGKHGNILHAPFMQTIEPYTELAIGGGNPLSHPDLDAFLYLCKKKKLIASITVNQVHFLKEYNRIWHLADDGLIHGIGISLTNPTEELIARAKSLPNAVIHVIAGVVSEAELEQLLNKNLKLLILGYKNFRRGHEYYSHTVQQKIDWTREYLPNIMQQFNTISFDNLAIQQLDVKNAIPDWKRFYMGDDGQFTMYIDTVNEQYAANSVAAERYPCKQKSLTEMFRHIRKTTK